MHMGMINNVGAAGFVTPGQIGKTARNVLLDLQTGTDVKEAVLKQAEVLAKDVLKQQTGIDYEQAKETFDTIKDILTGNDESKEAGGSGGIDVLESPQGINNGGNLVSYNPVPLETSLDTKIPAIGYGSVYQVSDSNGPGWHGLHLSRQYFQIPTDGPIGTYISQVITAELTNAVQQAVGFQVNLSVLTSLKVINALNSAITALMTYCFYDSILTYCSNPSNRNDGMFYLRNNNITSSGINSLSNLKRLIQGTPIPPNLVTICYWLCQTYVSSSLPGAPVLKIMPVDAIKYSMDTSMTTALNSLSNPDVQATFNQLSRACPKWMAHKLTSSNSVALHDLQFMTLWSNLGWTTNHVAAGTQKFYPTISSTEDIDYSAATNTIDGAVFGLGAVYLSGTGWLPSFLKPYVDAATSIQSSRLTFFSSGGTGGFTIPDIVFSYVQERGETFNAYTNLGTATAGVGSATPLGFEPVLGINYGTLSQSSYRLTDYLFSVSSIGKLEDRRRYGNEGKRNKGNKDKDK